MLLWGVYTLIVYFGIPVHGRVLVTEAAWNAAGEACGADNFFCRGSTSFFSAIARTLARTAPFFWYIFISAISYGAFLGWSFLKNGTWNVRIQMRPWHVFALFLASLWLIFTVLSVAEWPQGGKMVSPRRVIQPHPSVYTSDNQEGLQELQKNFNHLLERGCLIKTRDIRENVGEYRLTTACVQKSFVTRVLSQVVFLLVLILTFLVIGRMILFRLRFRSESVLLESVLSVGVGVCAAIAFLWTIAVLHILNATVGWLAIAGTLCVGYRHTRYWIKTFLSYTWDIKRPWYSFTIICAWLLIGYLALNFLTVVRPFPIGWDDLGSYLNRPRLMVSYGHFIHSLSPFQWEYMAALGYLLYGYESVFGSTASMLITWMAGLFAVFSILTFGRVFLGKGSGIIAALIYYTLPLVGHFSFADMKTDNAVFFFQTLSVLCVFLYLFPREDDHDASWSWKWLVFAGMFIAFAFGTKVTAIMVLMTIFAVLVGALLHWSAFFGAAILSLAVFAQFGGLNVASTITRVGLGIPVTKDGFILACVLVGFIILSLSALHKRKISAALFFSICVLFSSFIVFISPWILHNNILAGNIVPKLMFSAPNTITPILSYKKGAEYSNMQGKIVRSLPSELLVDPTHSSCKSTGRKEELGRYWGFRDGWGHYITLPWRTVMNIDSAGYYVTTSPILLIFPLLLLLPFFWISKGRWLRWLFAGTVFLIMQWMFMANGVPWYGIGVFLGIVIGLEALFIRAPDALNRSIFVVLLSFALMSCFAMRFWQFEQQRNLLEYPMGKASAGVMRERTIPNYDDIMEMVLLRNMQLPDRPYLYRVGTFIPYFIPKNLEIIGIADHQLDTFNCLHQEKDNALTLERLKALGFNSIIFDTNTATIEQDKNGSLHKKVNAFVDFLNDPSIGLQIMVNDPNNGVVFILIP